MAKVKQALKSAGRQVWESFKSSIPAGLMYLCAGTVFWMLTMDEENLAWDNKALLWLIVCVGVAAVYNVFISYAQGGQGYEMLVSGNLKRSSAEKYGSGYKISTHKEYKEFRYWRGFLTGGMIGILPIVTGIVFAINQEAIDASQMGRGLAVFVLISFFLSGWSILPFYYLNAGGAGVSYLLGCLFGIIPIAVTGILYIVGAYGKRNKNYRKQQIAEQVAKAEANRERKINYGGLPGTKPKKRK